MTLKDLLYGRHKTDVITAHVHEHIYKAVQKHLQKIFKDVKTKRRRKS